MVRGGRGSRRHSPYLRNHLAPGGVIMPFGNAVGEGFVNPGIVVAKKVIIQGVTGQGLFLYAGSPAPGNLLASVAQFGTDGYTNIALTGPASYRNAGGGLWTASNLVQGGIEFLTASSEAGPWNLKLEISLNTSAPLTSGSWPQTGGSGITTVAQIVTVLENLGLLTP